MPWNPLIFNREELGLKKQHGGRRLGAGRKTIMSYRNKLALANESTLLQREIPGLPRAAALRLLADQIGFKYPSCKERYLCPKAFSSETYAILRECPRDGILSVLPKLSADHSI